MTNFRNHEVTVSKDADGYTIITAFNASPAQVATALRRLGWAIFPPEALPAPPQPRNYGRKGRARAGGLATSAQGAVDVEVRAESQLIRMLRAYGTLASTGLTDEEAAGRANLTGTCYWKRAGELREDGMIETLPGDNRDGLMTRRGTAGTARIVCRISQTGRDVLAKIDTE